MKRLGPTLRRRWPVMAAIAAAALTLGLDVLGLVGEDFGSDLLRSQTHAAIDLVRRHGEAVAQEHHVGVAVDLVSAGLTCAGITAVVVLGATNLFLISRRWGRRLVEGRAGKFFHVTPRRLAKAQEWFQRWGALALIFGRHIPGFRVPITVAAGTFGVSYRIFVLSVMISTITWSGIFIGVGKMLGGRIEDFMSVHRHTTPIILGVVGGAIVLFTIYRFWQLRNEHGQEPETSAS